MSLNRKNLGHRARKSGIWAEWVARQYFRLHGWKIVAKNYRTGRRTTAGEVDFIARRHKILAFVEVKKRSSLEAAAEAIRPAQKTRLINAAACFRAKNPKYWDDDIRFDAVLICFPWQIRHIPSAWDATKQTFSAKG